MAQVCACSHLCIGCLSESTLAFDVGSCECLHSLCITRKGVNVLKNWTRLIFDSFSNSRILHTSSFDPFLIYPPSALICRKGGTVGVRNLYYIFLYMWQSFGARRVMLWQLVAHCLLQFFVYHRQNIPSEPFPL